MSKSLVFLVKIDFNEDIELTDGIIGENALLLLPMWGEELPYVEHITIMHDGKDVLGAKADAEM